MIRKSIRVAVLTTVIAATGIATASSQQDPARYLLLATARTATMEKELAAAVASGYRVVAASRTDSAEVIVVLVKTTARYEYRLLATTQTGTLQREMNEAVKAGYRVVPRAVTTKKGGGTGGLARALVNERDDGELLVLMEKGPEATAAVQYQVLAASRTGTLQKEMSEAAEGGFELVALVSRSEHVAILERVLR